jgi:hypothetical protein
MNGLTEADKKYLEDLASRTKEISANHFLKAADELYWKNTTQLGLKLTGKDVHDEKDVLCIRKTFDYAQHGRLQSEKVKNAATLEIVKKFVNWVPFILAIGIVYYLSQIIKAVPGT